MRRKRQQRRRSSNACSIASQRGETGDSPYRFPSSSSFRSLEILAPPSLQHSHDLARIGPLNLSTLACMAEEEEGKETSEGRTDGRTEEKTISPFSPFSCRGLGKGASGDEGCLLFPCVQGRPKEKEERGDLQTYSPKTQTSIFPFPLPCLLAYSPRGSKGGARSLKFPLLYSLPSVLPSLFHMFIYLLPPSLALSAERGKFRH